MAPENQWTSCRQPSRSSGGSEAEVGAHSFAPGFGQILDPQPALQHLQLQVEAQHDMEIVRHLIGFGADEGPFDLVDGAIEGVERHRPELVREMLFCSSG